MLALLKATRNVPLWLRAAITSSAIGGAYLFQIPIEVEVPGEPFLLFFVIVVACALSFGRWIGFFAVVLSSVLSLPFFEPGQSLYVTNAIDLVKVALYLIFSGSLVPIVGAFADALLAAHEESAALAQREREKSVLLTELSHRVANNFAVISAVMRQKSNAISDPEAKSSIDEVIGQLGVMARIHGRISVGTNDQTWIDSQSFVRGLCEDIFTSYAGGTSRFTLRCVAISQPLHVSDAIPLGLILNELITNAQKYAFPAGSTGRIEVTLEKSAEALRLTVTDDGVGLQDKGPGSGLGHRLVRALAQQLAGTVELRSSTLGTRITVTFIPDRRHVGRPGEPSLKKANIRVVA